MNPLRRSLLTLPGLVLFPLLIIGGVAGYIFTTYALTGQTAEQPTAAATAGNRMWTRSRSRCSRNTSIPFGWCPRTTLWSKPKTQGASGNFER